MFHLFVLFSEKLEIRTFNYWQSFQVLCSPKEAYAVSQIHLSNLQFAFCLEPSELGLLDPNY